MMKLNGEAYARDGFLVTDSWVNEPELFRFRREVDRLAADSPEHGGVRNGLEKSAILRTFGESDQMFSLASMFLDRPITLTRLTIFDKTPSANWKVPFHQDLTIAVSERRQTPGFGPWSIKEGVHHVQPPVEILENTISLRVHLDDATDDNGALRVIPESHKLGRLTRSQIGKKLSTGKSAYCSVRAGAAMAMSPLLLHASSAATVAGHRRVLHYEYVGCDLPNGLAWA